MEEEFERFWSTYPKRHRASANPKLPARKAFLRLVASKIDPEEIIRAARIFAAEAEKDREAGTRFIPMASTWLNQQRFREHVPNKQCAAFNAKVFVEEGTPQWAAWQKARPLRVAGDFRIEGRLKRGWYFDSEWPVARDHDAAAEQISV